MKHCSLHHLLLFLLVFASPSGVTLAAEAPRMSEAAQRWADYEPAFQAFAASDLAHPPAPGGIVFAGSSIFREWTTLAEQMAPLPVLNRAFGGSRTGDQLARFDQVILTYSPKVIVYYCGSNDIKEGAMPPEIAANFRAFVTRVHAVLPRTRILFVSILKAPEKQDRWQLVDEANGLIRQFCAGDARLDFIDVNPAVSTADGQPRLELYREDKLHYLPPAYEGFTAIIKPELTKVWDAQQSAPTP
jgi:lysophospholipase L1-like esterase